eukprot:gene12902-13003_t
MTMASFISVAVLWIVAVVTPGPNFLMAAQVSVQNSRRSALFAVLGVGLGTSIWGWAGFFGVQVVFVAAPWAYAAMKLLGGLYLIYLGARLLATRRAATTGPTLRERVETPWSIFRLGLVTNLANPKSALFVASVFATALPPDVSLLQGAEAVALMVSISVSWYALVVCVFSTRAVAQVYARLRHWLDRLAGAIFVEFPMIDLTRRLEAAIRLGTEAGALALRMRPAPGAATAQLKGAQDWLTEADGAVEAFLAAELGKLFPEDGFQGEETGMGRPGVATWVVDPIDGTSNFARGGTRWCVSLGLIADGTPLVGVLVAPALGEIFAAAKGMGATLNGTPIRAAATDDPHRAMIEIGWSPRRPDAVYQAIVAHFMAAGAMVRSGGSGAMGLADVAAGRLDGYVEAHINLWDVAAALCILSEAGAAVSPFLQGPGPQEGDAILACAPGLQKLKNHMSGTFTVSDSRGTSVWLKAS